MPDHGIVVVGASAGGVEALADLAASLPGDLHAAVFVVLHLPADRDQRPARDPAPAVARCRPPTSRTASRSSPAGSTSPRPTTMSCCGPGTCTSPAGRARTATGPPSTRCSAAPPASTRTRVIGVVLSGALDDGTAGLLAIKSRGGIAVVQDPADALYPGMPGNALEHVQADHVLAAASVGKLLARLIADLAETRPAPAPAGMRAEVEMEGFSLEAVEDDHPGGPRGSRARTATACSGRSGTAAWSGTAAGSATPGRRRASSSSRARPWRRPCGSPCGAWRSGPPWPGGWPSRPAAAGTRSPPTRFEEQADEAQQAARLVRDLLLSPGHLRHRLAAPGRAPRAGGGAVDGGHRWLSSRSTGTWRSCSTTCGAPAASTSPATSGPSLSRRIEQADAGRRARRLRRATWTTSRSHPEEFAQLFNTILINVTSFFRDPPAWEYLRRRDHAPAARRQGRRTSRSGSGAPAAPPGRRPTRWRWCWPRRWDWRAFRERVKIYATDVDEEALARPARPATRAKQVEAVPPELLAQYFERNGRPLRVPHGPAPLGHLRPARPDPGRPDLALDLLVCRNTLMYFNAETQAASWPASTSR